MYKLLYILSAILLISSINILPTYGQTETPANSTIIFKVLSFEDFKVCPVLKDEYIKIDTNIYVIPGSYKPYLQTTKETVGGELTEVWFLNRTGATESMYIDIFIEAVIEATRPKSRNYTIDCAKNLATYLCSYNFIKVFQEPCNDMCSSFESCPTVLNMTVNNNPINVVPTIQTCLDNGVKEVFVGSCSSYSLTAGLPGWSQIDSESEEDDSYDKYPGGKTKGTILGFGILIALLLMILGLGFIMRVQSKK